MPIANEVRRGMVRIPRLLLAGAGLLVSCRDVNGPDSVDTSKEQLGTMRVSTRTNGGDLDEDGYSLSIDGLPRGIMPANEDVDFANQTTGTHIVSIVGVAPNCELIGDPVQIVTV